MVFLIYPKPKTLNVFDVLPLHSEAANQSISLRVPAG